MEVSVCPTWNIGGVRGKIIQELAKKSRKSQRKGPGKQRVREAPVEGEICPFLRSFGGKKGG